MNYRDESEKIRISEIRSVPTIIMGNIVKIIGYCSFGLAVIGVLASLLEDFDKGDIVLITFFIISGLAMVLPGRNMTKNAKKYKKYIAIIKNQDTSLINIIAEASNVSYDEAISDIEKMIKKGYFPGAYIDDTEGEIIFSVDSPKKETKKEIKVEACKSCGASNTIIVGKTKTCEYCGVPLS